MKIYEYPPPIYWEGTWWYGTPWIWVDGDKGNNGNAAFIDERLQTPTDLGIEIYGDYYAENRILDLKFRLRNSGVNHITGRLHGVLTEDGIQWLAPNGLQIHNRVPRIWWPDEKGFDVNVPPGRASVYTASWNFEPSWNTENLKVIAFVQSKESKPDSTFEIYQGAVNELSNLPSDIFDTDVSIATDFTLFHNTPNPFNPSTEIRFRLPKQGHVLMTVYDIQGREIKPLIDQIMPAGSHSVFWYGIDAQGQNMPSGVYILKIQNGAYAKSIKMSLLR